MKIVSTFFWLLFALNASAAIYYVDFDAGSDANNGTSTGTAWKHCHGDTNATGNAASTTPAAGDTIKFKGGVVYLGSIVIDHSGSSGAVTTYDGNSTGDWGTGSAVMDGNYVNHSTSITINLGVSHVTVVGFEIRNYGGFADNATNVLSAAAGTYTNGPYGYGEYSANAIICDGGSNTNLLFSNLLIHRIGQWRNTIGWDGSTVHGSGIYTKGQEGLIITNCEITKCGYVGITLSAFPNLKNVTVTDCYLHENINWAIDVNIQQAGGTIDGVTITKTRLMNLNQMGGDFQGPNPDAVHQNYIFMRTDGETTPWTNVFVTRCMFGDTNASPGGSGGTGAIFLSKGPSVNIYNNVFNRNWSVTGVIPIGYDTPSALTQIVRIYNNTFYRGCSGSEIALTGETESNRQIFVKNNLFVTDSGIPANSPSLNTDSGNGPKECDYNLYYSEVTAEGSKYVFLPGYLTFPQMESIGYETNGMWANPMFTSVANRDFTLQAGSPAINAGADLSAYFTTDYNGVTRTAPWDIGAYEFTNFRRATLNGAATLRNMTVQ
jgi:hypothetical protein